MANEAGGFVGFQPNPDVALKSIDGQILVGDAKDANNERVGNSATFGRIFSYQSAFGKMLNEGRACVGKFVIATNDPDAAQEWVRALNYNANLFGVAHAGAGRPNYISFTAGLNTFLVC
ncbi:MAG TPA: hypothetical protein VKU82_15765 [Planctomycetaceae bacterium]|nr:hypothetical protein [Planctomycetaceae bacterium]